MRCKGVEVRGGRLDSLTFSVRVDRGRDLPSEGEGFHSATIDLRAEPGTTL